MPSEETFRLVVLGDSIAYYDDRGPLLPSDPTLYPNVCARILEAELGRPVIATILAEPGSDSRRAWHAVTKDPHVKFDVLAGAGAVVVGLGSFDHAPMGVPPAIEALIPFLRPASARRRIRAALRTVYPWGIKLTRGMFTRIPPKEFERLFDGLLFQIRALTRGAPGVVMGPVDHRSAYYGGMHPRREAREELQFEIARRHGFPAVSCWELVEGYAEKLNSDGIHWPADAHAAVGEALAVALLPQIRGEEPSPPAPAVGDLH
jgi:hypothetical protein